MSETLLGIIIGGTLTLVESIVSPFVTALSKIQNQKLTIKLGKIKYTIEKRAYLFSSTPNFITYKTIL